MNKQILKGILTLATIVAVGSMATYAAFTSNTATLNSNALTTGEASIKLCDVQAGNSWNYSITPSLSLSNMIPGVTQDLTDARNIYIGNDNGALNTNDIGSGRCTGYGDTAGSSDVTMEIVPKITLGTCSADMAGDTKLKISFNGVDSTDKTLTSWVTNTTAFGDDILVDGTAEIKMLATYSSSGISQNENCTFDVNFQGKQV